MAKENAAQDQNGQFSLLAVDLTTGETRLLKVIGGGLGVIDMSPWGYDQATDSFKNEAVPAIPLQFTTHNAVAIGANTLGTEVSVSIKGYKQIFILVTSDRNYDLYYRITDGVASSGQQTSLVTAQASAAVPRQHPLVSGTLWLFGDTLKVQPKNVDGALSATMTVSVYALP